MKRQLSLLLGTVALAAACTDPFTVDRREFLSAASAEAAFATVPLGYSDLTSSYAGDSEPTGFMFLPGPGMRGFGPGGLMGGGLGDAFAGAMAPGRGFGHGGPFGGRFGGGRFTCEGAFNAATGRFVCTPLTRNGVTITQSMAYANAAGAVQQSFDTVTTNSVNVQTATTGTVTFERGSSNGRGPGPRHGGRFTGDTTTILTATTQVNNSSNRTVTGLASGSTQRTVNGTSAGSESVTGTSSRGNFTATRTAGDTTRSLVVPIENGKPTYPRSGSVTREMKVTVSYAGSSPVTTTRREVITYDGSATAKVVITTNGVAKNCTMALPRGRPECP